MLGHEVKHVLEEKLNYIDQLKVFIKTAEKERERKNNFTNNGGLFYLDSQIPRDGAGPLVPGSFEWIINRRTFIESLPKDLFDIQGFHSPVVKVRFILNDILLRLEGGEINSDSHLVNQLLLFFTNCILDLEDSSSSTRYESLIRTIGQHFNVQ
mgnify:CR=1 FL=1